MYFNFAVMKKQLCMQSSAECSSAESHGTSFQEKDEQEAAGEDRDGKSTSQTPAAHHFDPGCVYCERIDSICKREIEKGGVCVLQTEFTVGGALNMEILKDRKTCAEKVRAHLFCLIKSNKSPILWTTSVLQNFVVGSFWLSSERIPNGKNFFPRFSGKTIASADLNFCRSKYFFLMFLALLCSL